MTETEIETGYTELEILALETAVASDIVDIFAKHFKCPDREWSCEQRALMVKMLLASTVGAEMAHREGHGQDPEDALVRADCFQLLTRILAQALSIECGTLDLTESEGDQTRH